MPDGDIMRATIEGHFDGEPVVLTLGFVSGAGMPDFVSDANNLINAIVAALDLTNPSGAYLAPLSVGYKLDALRVQDLAPGVSASVVAQLGGVGANSVEDAAPSICALCVTWRTGLKGKQNRGRTYLTGFAEDSMNAGYWIDEIQTWAAAAFAQPLMDAFGPTSAAGYSLSVVHTVSGGNRLAPPTATPITSYTVNNTVRSQRRRGVGVRISRRRSAP